MWGTDYNEWRLVLMAPFGWPGRIFALTVAALSMVLAWRSLRADTRTRRYGLLGLRLGGLLCVLVLFFQPALKLRNVTRMPNHIAVVVDTSESMSLAEDGGENTRTSRVAALLKREEATLRQWQDEHKLDLYSFGERLQPLPLASALRPAGPPAHGDATLLREALAAVRQRYEGRDLAGVVVLSDGIDNGRLAAAENPEQRGVLDADTRDFLRTLDAPVHTVAMGKPGLHDVAVTRVMSDQFAFARTAVEVEARVVVLGAEAAGWIGRRLPVTLRRDGVPVLTVEVTLTPGQREYRVVFPFTPERVGKYLYDISTPILPGEAIQENNRRAFVLKVVRDKIRVVHVAGRPTWDVRFLRGLLKSDPNVDLVAFFILRSPSDIEYVSSDETSLIPFPCEELFQEQLKSFDIIFLHNFNYSAYCGQFLQPAIVPFINEGGAVAMVGGDLSFTPGGYYGSELAQILPVVLLPDDAPVQVDAEPFRPKLTPAGRAHVVTALKLDVRENAARWESLPPLEGLNLVARARPQATVLLAHPKLKDLDGSPMPVLTVAEFGKGRTMSLQVDSSWRWAFGAVGGRGPGSEPEDGRGSSYQRLFTQAIRWLVRDPSLRLLRVESAEAEYRRGLPAKISVRALGPDYQPAAHVEVTLSLTRINPEPMPGEKAPPGGWTRTVRTDEDGAATLDWEGLAVGGYRVVARAVLSGRSADDSEVFLVRGAGRELETAEADDHFLRLISQATGGEARSAEKGLAGLRFLEPQIVRVNQQRDVELWHNFAVLAIAVLCFSLNWSLRRRWGYA